VNAPNLEAIEIVEKLSSSENDSRVTPQLRMTLFNLAKFIKEEQFADEFLRREGIMELIKIINSSHGNMLAVRIPLLLLPPLR
jgi:engulfment/cell motility protein 1